jgi:hypothetical protein
MSTADQQAMPPLPDRPNGGEGPIHKSGHDSRRSAATPAAYAARRDDRVGEVCETASGGGVTRNVRSRYQERPQPGAPATHLPGSHWFGGASNRSAEQTAIDAEQAVEQLRNEHCRRDRTDHPTIATV